jgi:DNA-binding response OmpR family regulator
MGKHVLLVENEPSHQELVQTALELENYSVTLAQNGLEALDLLANEVPSVIVLDLWMPEMSGYTFLERWRERAMDDAVPIIVLTADAQAELKLAHENLIILVKPFSMVNLLKTIARCCS